MFIIGGNTTYSILFNEAIFSKGLDVNRDKTLHVILYEWPNCGSLSRGVLIISEGLDISNDLARKQKKISQQQEMDIRVRNNNDNAVQQTRGKKWQYVSFFSAVDFGSEYSCKLLYESAR